MESTTWCPEHWFPVRIDESVPYRSIILRIAPLPNTGLTFALPSISLPFLQDDISEEHKKGTVDGSKAGEIFRSLVVLSNTESVKAGMEAVIEADADAVVRMLTGSSGVSSGARVSESRVESK